MKFFVLIEIPNECSTPCGITDYFGVPPIGTANYFFYVLNALRHHGLFRCRPAPIRACSLPCAQRLAASRTISVSASRLAAMPVGACSTPCGITDYFGLAPVGDGQPFTECSTPCGITDYFGCACHETHDQLYVLNALRHHGLFRGIQPPQLPRPRAMCSTPCGITDYFGGGQRGSAALSLSSAQRLAASRTISGGEFSLTPTLPAKCSTPCGITDYFGTTATAATLSTVCAQRLAASRTISDSADERTNRHFQCAQRLAASRTISAIPSSATKLLYPGAQRLAASRTISDRYRVPLPAGHGVLNALRHHGLFRGIRAREGNALLLCSTPCGITDYFG